MGHLIDLERQRRTPAYPFGEAAHYLNLPVSTLRAWCLGRGGPHRFRPVIRLDGKPGEGLSFINLVEAHVLAALRRLHGVKLGKVRGALDYVARQLQIDRPLADIQFQTGGVDLFVEQLDRLVNVSRDGQLEMASLLRAHLKRIERDPSNVPIKLYPFTTSRAAPDAPAPVVIDPRIAFGRPVLKGKGVPTAILADRFKAGDSLKELAGDYEAPPEDIEEAVRCELDRRAAA
jgi:uncharacterized protein (DUF433 family)